MKKKVAIVIPCRSGSKRIPDKNMRTVGGKTLIFRAANAAVNIAPTVGMYDIERTVVVSSDKHNHERLVSELASLTGVRVKVRSPGLMDGPSEAVVVDATASKGVDVYCLVQCTSPFLLPQDIEGCINGVLSHGIESCRTATIQKLSIRNQNRNIPHHVETGGCYAATSRRLLQKVDTWGPHYIDPMRAIEIDEPHELELANIIAEAKGW